MRLTNLTPKGITVPYGICIDSRNSVWVAAKNGLFRFDPSAQNVLFRYEHTNPRQIAAFCSVHQYFSGEQERIMAVFANERAEATEILIYDLDQNMLDSYYIEGKINSLALNAQNDLFATFNSKSTETQIFHTTQDEILGWNMLISCDSAAYTHLVYLEKHEKLLASTVTLPRNMYSNQEIHIIDPKNASLVAKFSQHGMLDGQVYWPRCLKETKEGNIAILDKTGRIQSFDIAGTFQGTLAEIPKFLGNEFCFLGQNRVIFTCSGVISGENGRAICNDWLEMLEL